MGIYGVILLKKKLKYLQHPPACSTLAGAKNSETLKGWTALTKFRICLQLAHSPWGAVRGKSSSSAINHRRNAHHLAKVAVGGKGLVVERSGANQSHMATSK